VIGLAKHTRPPWGYVPEDGTVRSTNRGKTYNVICEVGVRGVKLAKVDHANGHLMAAAPELYEALYDLLTYAQEDEAFCDPAGDPDRYAAKVLAEDAIRKAEGR
jgi:hypothetical protein